MRGTIALIVGVAMSGAAAAAEPVAIGMSGWTGFAPLTLAREAGLFERHGLDVTIAKIPQKDRHLAVAAGSIQCAATTVETFIVWRAAGVPLTQVVQLDRSNGADGMVVRAGIGSIAELRGKTVAASAPGTAPYFTLAWFLARNGLSVKDVSVVNMEPGPAAQAFIAGQNDAAMTYEPYLSAVRSKPEAGKIIATTQDYPMIMDTLGCTPALIAERPQVVKGLVEGYFEALAMIAAKPDEANAIMGADVKQTATEFAASAAYLQWQDRAANKAFLGGGLQAFSKDAAALLLDIGVIRKEPDLENLADPSFVE